MPKTKDVKAQTDMFKAVKQAGTSGAADAIMGMTAGLGPMSVALSALSLIIKPFEPLLKIIGKAFSVLMGSMGAEVLKVLIPAIKPFIGLLVQLSPLFKLIGWGLGWLLRIGLLPFAAALYGIGLVIAGVVDFITRTLDAIDFLNLTPIRGTDFVGAWNKMMLPALAGMITAPAPMPEFQGGGMVPGSRGQAVPIIAHGQETVHKEGLDDEILSELQQINAYNRWKMQQKRLAW